MIDAYKLIKEGKTIDEIQDIVEAEIYAANDKIMAEEKAAAEEAKKQETIDNTRKAAVAALMEYFALVNTDVTEKIINSVITTLESLKVKETKNKKSYSSETSLLDWLSIFDLFLR